MALPQSQVSFEKAYWSIDHDLISRDKQKDQELAAAKPDSIALNYIE